MIANSAAPSTRAAVRIMLPRMSLLAIGAGIGIGQIGKGALEAIARQPEASNDIRGNMILTAALVEGAALFAIIVGFLAMVL